MLSCLPLLERRSVLVMEAPRSTCQTYEVSFCVAGMMAELLIRDEYWVALSLMNLKVMIMKYQRDQGGQDHPHCMQVVMTIRLVSTPIAHPIPLVALKPVHAILRYFTVLRCDMARLEPYQNQLLTLLPLGVAWPREPDCSLGRLMGGLAEEYARVDALSEAIATESLPSQVTQLIDEWEAEYGLPEGSSNVATTLQERRNAVVQKYQQYGSQSREFLIAMSAALGFDLTITEYTETTFGGEFGGDFYGTDWAFVVQTNISALNVDQASIDRLEQMLRRLIHAHKVVLSNRTETNYLAVDDVLLSYAGEPVAVTFNSTDPVEA